MPKSSSEKPTPCALQRGHLGDDVFDVVEQQALGEFELELAAGRRRCCRSTASTWSTKSGWRNWRALTFTARVQMRQCRLRCPGHQLGAGGFQHPLAERQDQPGFLGQRNELGRRRPCRAADAASAPAPRRRSCGRRHRPAAGSGARTGSRARPRAGRPPGRRGRRPSACMSRVEEAQRVAAGRLGLVHGECRPASAIRRRTRLCRRTG